MISALVQVRLRKVMGLEDGESKSKPESGGILEKGGRSTCLLTCLQKSRSPSGVACGDPHAPVRSAKRESAKCKARSALRSAGGDMYDGVFPRCKVQVLAHGRCAKVLVHAQEISAFLPFPRLLFAGSSSLVVIARVCDLLLSEHVV